MKDKNFIIIAITILINFFFSSIQAGEIINFDVTEIEIKEEGNIIIGKNRGIVSVNDGSKIESDTFIYNKSKNIITFSGDVISFDTKNDIKIYASLIEYNKKNEIITTYGQTEIAISSKYKLNSTEIIFDKKKMSISSKEKTNISDNFKNNYYFEKFTYLIDREILKASNIFFKNSPDEKNNSDNFFFKDGFFDLKNKNFKSGDIKIKFNKNIFGNDKNDPRLYAISAKKDGNITELNKAIFTSCKENENCPPWSLSANKITHDKDKKLLIYNDAILKIYKLPVIYFPKFFHPDPTVDRQSGFLTPFFNKSNITGSSFQLPYYQVISENRDITIKPTLFNKDMFLIQNEYRFNGKRSSFSGDFGYLKGYNNSVLNNKKKNINHIFAKYNLDLKLPNFLTSNLRAKTEKTNNDTYLKVFESNLANTINLPSDANVLSSELELELNHEEYNFLTGVSIYENLQMINSDRYQYILPYYNFSKIYFDNVPLGYINLVSKGDNNLINTNNLKSKILNTLSYKTYNFYSEKGFVNNIGVYLKNLNITAKNDTIYKSSFQSKLMGLTEFNTNLPLISTSNVSKNTLTPKLSFKVSSSDMENYSNENSKINYSNIFDHNRLGIEENFEPGSSLTYGIEYKKEDINNINKYFSFNLASVFRLNEENHIPINSTLNNKNSNYFGLIKTKWDDLIELKYDFSINENLNKVEYSSAQIDLNKNNFFSSVNYIKEKGQIGDENVIQGLIGYRVDENNNVKFETRRNRKLGLTEYYDLIYEYRNDCLTAGIKYKKLYYSDKEIKPTENLFFSITIFPITTFEQSVSTIN